MPTNYYSLGKGKEDVQPTFPASGKSETYPEASAMLWCSQGSRANLGLVGLAETALLLGAWEGSWQKETACSALLSAVRNPGFGESEGERHCLVWNCNFCCCCLGFSLKNGIYLFTENSVSSWSESVREQDQDSINLFSELKNEYGIYERNLIWAF